jgi:hypothetical protein
VNGGSPQAGERPCRCFSQVSVKTLQRGRGSVTDAGISPLGGAGRGITTTPACDFRRAGRRRQGGRLVRALRTWRVAVRVDGHGEWWKSGRRRPAHVRVVRGVAGRNRRRGALLACQGRLLARPAWAGRARWCSHTVPWAHRTPERCGVWRRGCPGHHTPLRELQMNYRYCPVLATVSIERPASVPCLPETSVRM